VTETSSAAVASDLPLLDTVHHAAGDPDREQPWAELGLKEDEYAEIKSILGRPARSWRCTR
jgi:phosphoribosylformylglycinamidine synthase